MSAATAGAEYMAAKAAEAMRSFFTGCPLIGEMELRSFPG
jgi:hypothetical protein